MKHSLKILERDVLAAVLEWLAWKRIYHWRTFTGGIPLHGKYEGRFRPPPAVGIADILCLHRGMFYALEVKSPTGIASDNQKNFLLQINKNGGIGVIIRSVKDLEQLFRC